MRVLLFLPLLCHFALAQAPAPLALDPDKTYDRTLAPGAIDTFTLELKQDQMVALNLKDKGKEVILSVYAPDGQLSRGFSSELLDGDAARFFVPNSGMWTLKVSGRGKELAARYEISGVKVTTPSAPAPKPDTSQSPRIKKLSTQADVDAFWKDIGPHGSPLIEAITDDPANRLATFLWRGGSETTGVLVMYQDCFPEMSDCLMRHVEGTDLWYKTFKIDRRLRTYYLLVPNPPPISKGASIDGGQLFARGVRDPLNPKIFPETPNDPDVPAHRSPSKLEMPDAPPQPWAEKRPDVPQGRIEKVKFPSVLLKNTRSVWVYTPPGYSKEASPYDLLLVFDGDTYINVVPTPVTLDNLTFEKRIAPTVALIIGNAPDARGTELPCNPTFADFLSSELVAWARRTYNVTHDPRRVTIGGSSYGGLAATYAAYRHPETFGNVLSQSGSYWWTPPTDPSKPGSFAPDAEPSYVAQLFVNSPRLPIRFYLDAGSMELDKSGKGGSILVPNRHLRDVLRARGYEVFYQEFQGAHDYMSWRGTIADGLILLAGKPPEAAAH